MSDITQRGSLPRDDNDNAIQGNGLTTSKAITYVASTTGATGATSYGNVQIQCLASNSLGTFTANITIPITSSGSSSTITSSGSSLIMTAPAAVFPGQAGCVASVPTQVDGTTYTWNLSSATLTSGSGTNSIIFTVATSGATGSTGAATGATGSSGAYTPQQLADAALASLPDGIIALILKYCAMALTLMKDAVLITQLLAKITPALETALRADPNSEQGKANSASANAGNAVASAASQASKAALKLGQIAQSVMMKILKNQLKIMMRTALLIAASQMAKIMPVILQVIPAIRKVKKDICIIPGAIVGLYRAQKNLRIAILRVQLLSQIPVPNMSAGTAGNWAKSTAKLAANVARVAQEVNIIVPAIAQAAMAVQNAENAYAQAQSLGPDIRNAQIAISNATSAITSLRLPPNALQQILSSAIPH